MDQQKQKNRFSLTIVLVSGFLILAAGIWLTLWTGEQVENNLRKELLTRANEIAQAINPLLVKELDFKGCLLYTSPSPRDRQKSRMPSSA